MIRRKGEETLRWISFAGRLEGLELPEVTRPVEVKPFGTTTRTDGEALDGVEWDWFVTKLLGLRLDLNPSNRLMLMGSFQYNDAEERLLTNLRLRLIHREGSDLYLVYNENRNTAGRWDVEERQGILKLTYLWRFR